MLLTHISYHDFDLNEIGHYLILIIIKKILLDPLAMYWPQGYEISLSTTSYSKSYFLLQIVLELKVSRL